MTQSLIKKTENKNDVLILTIEGSLDVSVQKKLREEIEKQIRDGSDVVLDLSQVSFIDSSCLGALVALSRQLKETKGNLKLALLNDDVRSIFQITRLDRIFEIFDEIDEAVDSYFR